MNTGIYQITNTVNGKRYIGSAVNLRRRWNLHRLHLRRGTHHCRHLQAAWVKYGESTFVHRILLVCKPEQLTMYEQLCLDGLKPEYNTLLNARSARGYRHTPEALRKLRSKRLSPEHKAKIGAAHRGKTVSETTRAKLRALRIGKGLSPAAKAKFVAAGRAARWAGKEA